jgi:hypothetical protein
MYASQQCKHVIVETEDDFDRVIHEHAVEVPLPNEDAQDAYERTDDGIARQLQALLAEMFGEQNDGILYHQNWDWWPTRTRFIWFDAVCVSWQLLDRMQSLLVGDVEDWRINIHVHSPLDSDKSPEVGGMNVYRDWILVQKAVYDLLAAPQA